MNNPAFIVDGHMEKKIIECVCPGKPVKILGCNGKTVSYEAAAKRAATLIRLLKKHHPIVLIFDREKRKASSAEVALELEKAIVAQGIQSVDLIIGVPDSMIENWLLADIDAIKNYYQITSRVPICPYEGVDGKSVLRSIVDPKTYSETQDGPQIFKKCDINALLKNSDSFSRFVNKLNLLDCLWLKAKTTSSKSESPDCQKD